MTTTSEHSLPRRLFALLVAASLSLTSVAAFAEPTAADKETAREYMAQGRAHRAKGDHKAALDAFKAAHAIMNVPTTGLELGITQMDLGMLLEARETLLAAAKHPESPGEPPKFATARAEAKSIADGLAIRIPSLRIVFSGVSSAEGVVLTIDERNVPVVGLEVMRKVNPGTHAVVARAGGKEKKTSVEVKEAESLDVTIDFGTNDAPQVEAPKPVTGPKKDDGDGAKVGPLAFIGFGVAGAGLVAGGVTGLLSMSKASSVRDRCIDGRCPPETHADYDSARTLGTVSTISFVVAGAGAIVGVIGIVLAKPKRESGPSVSLFVGPGQTGLVGSF